MNNLVTSKDIELFKSNFVFDDTTKLPLSYYRNGERADGIGDDFKVTVSESEKNGVIKTVYSADDEKGLNIRYEITQYTDFPVAEYVAFFTNTSDSEGDIISQPCAFRKTVEGEHPIFTYGTGDTSDGRGYHYITQDLLYRVTLSPISGNPCCGASPFMKLDFDDFRLRLGIGWPGLWEMNIEPELTGVNIGVIQKRSYIRLKPGETIRTPSLTVMCFEGDDNKGINLWRRWYFEHIMPKKNGKKIKPMVTTVKTREGYVEFTGANEKEQVGAIDDNIKKGFKPDVWWIDAGWYQCNKDWTNTGNWYADPERFPNGLAPVGAKCKENNIDFLLWFEPERAKLSTQIHTEHPEWFLPSPKHLYKGKLFYDGILNLGNPDCLEWITNKIDGLIKEYGVTIYRQDFNHDFLPTWMNNESEERMGAVENAHVQGYLKYWDELLKRNPGLLIDTCAGGGRRNEMETIKRGVPFHYTDVAYGAHPLRQKQIRMMNEWIPFYRLLTEDWRDENGTYRPDDVKGERNHDMFTLINSIAPAIQLKPKWELEGTKRVIDFIPVWRRAADIMLGGDFYPLTECNASPREFYAVQFEDTQKRCGFVQIVNNSCNEENVCVLKLHFEEDRNYKFEEADKSFVLSQDGKLTVTMEKGNAKIFFYTY